MIGRIWARIISQARITQFGTALCALAFMGLGVSRDTESWTLRVCAHPNNYPISAEGGTGFENEIAEIVAEELDARLEFVWIKTGAVMVREYLRPGRCDVVFGIAEGAMNLETTVSIYRVPYVLLYPSDAPFELESLDDPELEELWISTYPNSIPHRTLEEKGLGERITVQRPEASRTGAQRFAPIVESLRSGESDVAMVYGGVAGPFVQENSDEFEMVVLPPEVIRANWQMSRVWVAGVRPGDTALRDNINEALASRWDEIQEVFESSNVPLRSTPRPGVRRREARDTQVRIGVVLPLPNGNDNETDVAARAGSLGVDAAENLLARGERDGEWDVRFYRASSPDAEAAGRAARRLIATDDVHVLVGGLGEKQADTLSEVAENRGALFFNVGEVDSGLRREKCQRSTFHVEASADMYMDAMVRWYASHGSGRWYFVYQDTEQGQALYEAAQRALERSEADAPHEVGASRVPVGVGSYQSAIEEVQGNEADVVGLLLPPTEQELFLSQFGMMGVDADVTGFPYPRMQTRRFLQRLQQIGRGVGSGVRIALWDTTLEASGAGEINRAFVTRSGETMSPTGWASYAAVRIAVKAAEDMQSTDAEGLIRHLERQDTNFEVGKSVPVSFREWNHQLRQPLYAIQIDPEARWGREIQARAEIARVAGELPMGLKGGSNTSEKLDVLGLPEEDAHCTF